MRWSQLQLICSGGKVVDCPLNDKPWSLGEYIKQHGGTQNRSKKIWGVHIPDGIEETTEVALSTSCDSVRTPWIYIFS